MHRNRSIWFAVLLIGIGVVLLLQQADVIADDVEVWPLILMGVGIVLLLERIVAGGPSGAGFVAPLVIVAIGLAFFLEDTGTFEDDGVLLPLVVIAIGAGLVMAAIPTRRGEPTPERADVPLDGATRGRVEIEHGAGRLRIGSHIGGTNLVEGSFGGGVDLRQRRDGDLVDVGLTANPWRTGFPWPRGGVLDWSLTFARHVPLEVRLKTGANTAEIDLSDVQAERITLETGASKTVLTLPSTGRPEVRIRGGAADIQVVVPSRMAAEIETHTGMTETSIDQHRFPRTGDVYRSVGYEDSPHRARIVIEAGAASVRVS